MRIKAFAAFGCRRDGYLSIVAIQELFESCIAAADGRVFLSRASQSVRHTLALLDASQQGGLLAVPLPGSRMLPPGSRVLTETIIISSM